MHNGQKKDTMKITTSMYLVETYPNLSIWYSFHLLGPLGLAIFNPIVITNSTTIVWLISLVHQIRIFLGKDPSTIKSKWKGI
jgi:hypothetical protein